MLTPIATDEGNSAFFYATFFYKVRNVGVIAGKPGTARLRAQRGAPLPTARVEKNNVARRNLDMPTFPTPPDLRDGSPFQDRATLEESPFLASALLVPPSRVNRSGF